MTHISDRPKLLTIQKIQNGDIKTAVFQALEAIHAERLMIKEGMKILLKPNVIIAKGPERAATTHPEVVRAVIHWLRQFKPSQIILGDSSGGLTPNITVQALKNSQLQALCTEEGIECVPFEKTERRIYTVQNPLILSEIASTVLLHDVDLIINLPKIKTHGQCTMTCCIKNMFGTVILTNKGKLHAQFPTIDRFTAALVDIYSVSAPQLTVIDGYLCQEGNGPTAGDIVKMDLICAGYDPVALDTMVCRIIQLDPARVKYLEKAEFKGLGSRNLNEFEIKGAQIADVTRKFKIPFVAPVSMPLPDKVAKFIAKRVFQNHIKISPQKCKLCATCWTNCPVGALSPPNEMKIGKTIPVWDQHKCVSCFCCAELCPHEAIEFKIPMVKNALFSEIGIFSIAAIAILVILLIVFL